ncbi:MAG: hypothetical protein ACTSR2_01140 [Candidatus Hodarchaeales archaeon]
MATRDLTGLAWGLVIFTIIAGLGVYTLEKFQAELEANGTAYTVVGNLIDVFSILPGWVKILVIVSIVAIIIYAFSRAGSVMSGGAPV